MNKLSRTATLFNYLKSDFILQAIYILIARHNWKIVTQFIQIINAYAKPLS